MTGAGKDFGILFVVGTPIGNLEDISLRALRVLGEVALIAAEDTRVTAKLKRKHGIATPLTSFREQNAARAVPELLSRLRAGDDVALVTDAGTPSVSDPGVDLVAAAAEKGITVVPIPGPSALATALSVAGFSGDGVRFLGFLPRGGKRRRERIQAIAEDPSLIVLYESPKRLAQTLTDLAEACGERTAAVLRELTKMHEEVARGTLSALVERFAGRVLGEITIVLAGTEVEQIDLSDERLVALVRAEIEKGYSVKDVATNLSSGLGVPRKRVYDIAVTEMQRNSSR
ncbi:MAG: 16S rRNA (cytidine(1402)-2'-O)-methyltransferase [Proteobacteria bacterium]|nr:16S rRNA (cytidine(1402)-2'-O)-methyltransferase [Pseudomonadota bacterium]